MSKIFISYRRLDSRDVAGRIFDHLAKKIHKDNIFKDVDSIPIGEDFREVIAKKIESCDFFFVIIGKRWLDNNLVSLKPLLYDPEDFVRIEIETAIEKKVKIIPVLVSEAEMPKKDFLPESIRDIAFLNAFELRYDPYFKNDVSKLISIVKYKKNFKLLKAVTPLFIISCLAIYYGYLADSIEDEEISNLGEKSEIISATAGAKITDGGLFKKNTPILEKSKGKLQSASLNTLLSVDAIQKTVSNITPSDEKINSEAFKLQSASHDLPRLSSNLILASSENTNLSNLLSQLQSGEKEAGYINFNERDYLYKNNGLDLFSNIYSSFNKKIINKKGVFHYTGEASNLVHYKVVYSNSNLSSSEAKDIKVLIEYDREVFTVEKVPISCVDNGKSILCKGVNLKAGKSATVLFSLLPKKEKIAGISRVIATAIMDDDMVLDNENLARKDINISNNSSSNLYLVASKESSKVDQLSKKVRYDYNFQGGEDKRPFYVEFGHFIGGTTSDSDELRKVFFANEPSAVTYRIDYKNKSKSEATMEELLVEISFNSAIMDIFWLPTNCFSKDKKIQCKLHSLKPNEAHTIYYVLNVKKGKNITGIFKNNLTVASDEKGESKGSSAYLIRHSPDNYDESLVILNPIKKR